MTQSANAISDPLQAVVAGMPASVTASVDLCIDQAATRAGAKIAPLWPLQHFVAVNPMLGLAEHAFSDSGRLLARAAGARLTMPRSFYESELVKDRISDANLIAALAELRGQVPASLTARQVRAEAANPEVDPASLQLPTVATVAAPLTDTDWSSLVVSAVSNWAGDYFDRGIAAWASPLRTLDPWPSYRARACIDRSAEFLGIPKARALFAALPDDPLALLKEVVTTLDIPPAGLEAFFHRLLADVSGWAGFARYRGWNAELRGEALSSTRQLLAIRAAWELVLYKGLESPALRADWLACRHRFVTDDARRWSTARAVDHVLHLAFERSQQRRLAAEVQSAAGSQAKGAQQRAAVQAVFCIDVRSERLRRALEQVWPQAETLGFAGFFGLAAAHRDENGHTTARCPVLLEPQFTVDESDAPGGYGAMGLRQRTGFAALWSKFRRAAVACFGYVEAAGLLYAWKLLAASWGRGVSDAPPAAVSRNTTLTFGLGLRQRINLAQGILRGMSLTDGFAPIVLFVGHGSTSANNPYASALDCGACGGHAGDANARLAAALLNDRFVRAGLLERDIDIPGDTVFVAGLHNTTTDHVDLEVGSELAAERPEAIAQLERMLACAGSQVRAERAPTLGLPAAAAVDGRVANRARDWSQVRPEWGLAGCAAFIAAPRSRTRAANLDGRSFLHTYDWRSDADFAVLETILTAPLVVASWITLQYFASTVDNQHFGSGDKTLHNVVGGFGVLEGISGDLRTGLPLQSIHNGHSLVHSPLRLMAIIESPTAALNQIINKHESLRHLIDNEWVQLHAMDEEGQIWRRGKGGQTWAKVIEETGFENACNSKAA
jgi:uncharacterized protein YbcC (UPF0753/DUF2309 family)